MLFEEIMTVGNVMLTKFEVDSKYIGRKFKDYPKYIERSLRDVL